MADDTEEQDSEHRPQSARPPILSPEELSAVIAGDPAAIKIFVKRLSPILMHQVSRDAAGRLPEADQQDVLQDIFAEIFRCELLRRWSPDGGRTLDGYLRELARRRTIDRLRRSRREISTDNDELLARADAAAHADNSRHPLDEIIAIFEKECRDDDWTILQQVLAGMSAVQAARALGISPAAVDKRRERVRARLKQIAKPFIGGKRKKP